MEGGREGGRQRERGRDDMLLTFLRFRSRALTVGLDGGSTGISKCG